MRCIGWKAPAHINNKWLIFLLLALTAAWAAGGEVYCETCQKKVKPYPNNTCPSCLRFLPPLQDSSLGACALTPGGTSGSFVPTGSRQIPVYSSGGTEPQFYLYVPDGPDEETEGSEEQGDISDLAASGILAEIKTDLNAFCVDMAIPVSAEAKNNGARLQRIISNLEPYLEVQAAIDTPDENLCEPMLQMSLEEPGMTPSVMDAIDNTVCEEGYQWTPFSESTFYEAVPGGLFDWLNQHLASQLSDSFLLIYFSPQEEMPFTFITFTLSEVGIFVTTATPNATYGFILTATSDALRELLGVVFKLLGAQEFYAYHYQSDFTY